MKLFQIYLHKCEQEHGDTALDKREYLVIIRDNFCEFCIKTYVVTPHLNHLQETVQMRGYSIWFRQEVRTRALHAGANAWL